MTGNDQQYVTIVSGLPRSGTSLMMQMLAAGGMPILTDHMRAADEDNPRGYYEYEPVKQMRHDPSWLESAVGKAVKVVHLLLYDVPTGYRYRVIFMKRKLEEVLASQRAMLARQGKKGAALPDPQLARLFEGQLNKLENWFREQKHLAVLPVSYNELVADPVGGARPVNEFLDNRLDPAAMMRVVDPALYRRRH